MTKKMLSTEQIRIPFRGYGMGDREYGECLTESDLEKGKVYVATIQYAECEEPNCDHTEEFTDHYWCGQNALDVVFMEVENINEG